MRKIITLGIMLLFLGMTISSTTGINLEKQSTIAPLDGNTLYVGGSGSGNYSKIQDAIDDSSNGDTVFVYDDSSPYYENLNVSKSISLIGEDRDTTVIDGSGKGDVIIVKSHHVFISGFTIGNSGNNSGWPDYDSGIDVRSSGITIKGNNLISNNGKGIMLFGSYSTVISNNHISENWGGIYISEISGDNSIISNTITFNHLYGICTYQLNFDTNISDNYISSNNGDGIILGWTSSNTTVINNIINSNNENGIYIESMSWEHNIVHNNISNNKLGILIYEDGSNIIKNNFIGNKRHASHWIQFFGRNHWYSNYWDNWIGIGPKLIFGRSGIFLFLPWVQFDWNPAQEPYDIEV